MRVLMLAALLASAPARADVLTASWYGPGFQGRATASGCAFHAAGLSAASRVLPLGTVLEVRRGDRTVVVIINDRGPYIPHRQLDLSRGAAVRLGMLSVGVAQVEVRVIGLRALKC